ncbi:hypothetical protein [Caballeronia sordidicola]|uniref:hypothetical protein n=1 Tax=Caballeronia sordidicola TaxID=196367 RepID=UPI000A760767|nr:hypothetical protein [Caballeronia sordidicola]
MIEIDDVLAAAEERLNSAYAEYEEARDGIPIEFNEMRLQATIFQYDICAEMTGLIRNAPLGFARNVALKGLVHSLFEYDLTLNQLIPRLLDLMKARKLPIDQQDIKAQRKKWAVEFRRLRAWSGARNVATGHYSPELAKQVEALKGIDSAEVMEVCTAFLSFNMAILHILAEAGRGGDA